MPKFVIEREIPGAGNLSDAQLREISQKSVNVLKGMGPEIHWLHSYVTGDKVYCVYLAPDEATIQEHARRVGVPANRVSAVRRLTLQARSKRWLNLPRASGRTILFITSQLTQSHHDLLRSHQRCLCEQPCQAIRIS